MVIKCRTTGLIKLAAMRTATTIESIRMLNEHWFSLFGLCSILISDRASYFTSHLFQQYIAQLGITHK